MTNKKIILRTLEHINNQGYVNVKDSLWTIELNLDIKAQDHIKFLLEKGKMVTVKMGEPYTFEITVDIGVPVLKNPSKLNDDGTLKKSIKSRLIEFKDRYWVLILISTYLLGILSPILTDLIKVQLPEEWFKRPKTINNEIILDSTERIFLDKDSITVDSVKSK